MIGYVILSIPNKAFINHHVLLEATGATVDSYRPRWASRCWFSTRKPRYLVLRPGKFVTVMAMAVSEPTGSFYGIKNIL
jgi:hypothetical protein